MGSDIVSGVVSGVVTAGVLALMALLYQAWRTQTYVVRVHISRALEVPNLRFGVLHARNDDGQIVNRVYWCKRTGQGNRHARIRHPRYLGFQYKCFVDYGEGWSVDRVMAELREAGFSKAEESAGRPRRVWFLLPDRPKAQDPEGNHNNHFYPE